MEFEHLLELFKVGLGVATLGGVAALRKFVKTTSEETMAPLGRDLAIVHERQDELRHDFDTHMETHHDDKLLKL